MDKIKPTKTKPMQFKSIFLSIKVHVYVLASWMESAVSGMYWCVNTFHGTCILHIVMVMENYTNTSTDMLIANGP